MRNLIVTFRKILTSGGFRLCVGMTVILLFSAEVYTDSTTQSRYTEILSEPIYPMWASFLYFGVLLGALVYANFCALQKMRF